MIRLYKGYLLSIVTASLVLLITLLYRCQFNLDVTDEGYYINWIAHPWIYKHSVTQFGFIYHFLYRLVAENIVLLRQLDVLILFSLAWVLTYQMLRPIIFQDLQDNPKPSQNYLYAISFTFASCIFVFFGAFWWMPTPSYNSLALESALITVIALVRLSKQEQNFLDYFILSIGYWLEFMAKPTTAALLILFSTLYLCLLHKKLYIRRQLIVGLMTLGWIGLCAWMIDGSLIKFYARLQHGLDDLFLLYKGEYYSGVWPLYGFLPEEPKLSVFYLSIMIVFLIIVQSLQNSYRYQYLILTSLLCLVVLICTNVYIVPLHRVETIAQQLLTNILFLAIPLGAGLALFITNNPHLSIKNQANNHRIENYICKQLTSYEKRYAFLLPIYLFFLPFALAFGTKMDVWTNSLRYSYFWGLMILPWFYFNQHLTAKKRWRILLSMSVCCVFFTAVLVQQAFEHPFHDLQPLRLQHQSITITDTQGNKKSTLIVSDSTANYITQLKKTAFAHGFIYGTPIINLTDTPVAPYLMGTTAFGTPWSQTAGADASANDYIASNLTTVSCKQLVKAWVLLDLDGGTLNSRYDMRVLAPYGINLQTYQPINSTIQIPDPFSHDIINQRWYKPTNINHQTIAQCHQKRAQILAARKNIRLYLGGEIPSSKNIMRYTINYLQQHQAKQAIALLENAVIMDTSNASFYNNLCFSYGLAQQFDQAEKACQAALALDPNYELAQNNLAWIKHKKNAA